MSEFCVQCGGKVEAEDRFCRNCGTSVTRDDAAVHGPEPAVAAAKFGPLTIALAGLCLLLIAVLVAVVVLPDRGANSPNASGLPVSPADLSGTWEGTYRYAAGTPPPVNFTLAASFEAGRVTGTIMEPHAIASSTPPSLTASIRGTFEGTSVRFSKRYETGRVVEYEGVLDPSSRTIQGSWQSANPTLRGTFQMVRRTSEQRVVAAVVQPPPQPLPTEVSQALILGSLRPQDCTVTWGAYGDTMRNPEAGRLPDRMKAWVETNVIRNPAYRVTADRRQTRADMDVGRYVELIDDQGSRVIANLTLDRNSFTEIHLTQLIFCAFHPSGVQILDTRLSADQKEAEVTYVINYTISNLARRVGSAGMNPLSIALPPPQQRRAVLRKLDATGWQVHSI